MIERIGSEIDVHMLEFNKLHHHIMVFEKTSMMTVCSSPKCVDVRLSMKWEASSNW